MKINYFGYGTNCDKDMMAHIVGNSSLKGEKGKLLGFELCIQKLKHIRNIIPKSSPINKSPRELINKNFGDEFELYIARPKQDGEIVGTIWELSKEELELVKEWELVYIGMQEEVRAIAINSKGKLINVETQALMKPPAEIDRVVKDKDYPAYIVSKEKMLKVADKSRKYILSLKKKD